MVLKERSALAHNGSTMKRQRQSRPSRFSGQYQPGKDHVLNGKGDQRFNEGPPARVDLSKLKVVSLRKYAKCFDLDVAASSSKEELTTAVAKHWASQVLRESDVLYNLMAAFQSKHAGVNGNVNGLAR